MTVVVQFVKRDKFFVCSKNILCDYHLTSATLFIAIRGVTKTVLNITIAIGKLIIANIKYNIFKKKAGRTPHHGCATVVMWGVWEVEYRGKFSYNNSNTNKSLKSKNDTGRSISVS